MGRGNELTRVTAPAVPGTPLTVEHPALAAAHDTFAERDPGRRYVATSPLGPRFDAAASEFGRGLHHDVHGPWEHVGSLESWREYWDADDAVMRSEVGVSGASPMDLLEHFALVEDDELSGTEARSELRQLWTHSSGWWLAQFDASDPDQPIVKWVDESQQRQAVMPVRRGIRSREVPSVCRLRRLARPRHLPVRGEPVPPGLLGPPEAGSEGAAGPLRGRPQAHLALTQTGAMAACRAFDSIAAS